MSERRNKAIVTITLNPCIDKSCEIGRVVAETKMRCENLRREPGGGGINVSRAIAKLSGQSMALWASGGPTGTMLADLLDLEGLEHRAIETLEPTRENLIVYETASGQQFRFGMPGAAFSGDDASRWQKTISALDPAPAFLVISGSLPPGAKPQLIAELAAAAPQETKVVVDTSGSALQEAVASQRVYLVKPNLHELSALSDDVDSDAGIARAAQYMVAQGIEAVVVSLGAGGAILVTADEIIGLRAPTVPIRSKVGAGDSTIAGAVLELARGKSLVDAIQFGIAAGSAAVMTPGTELCRLDDTNRLRPSVQVSRW